MTTYYAQAVKLGQFEDDLQTKLVPYEYGAGQVNEFSTGADDLWMTYVKKKLPQYAGVFNASANQIAQGYGDMIAQVAAVTVNPEDPLSAITSPTFGVWSGPSAYATPLARATAEAAAITAIAPWGAHLAGAILGQFRSYDNRPLSDYVAFVTVPAILEFIGIIADLSPVDQFTERALDYAPIISELPRVTLGSRPLYTVTYDDTMDSLANNILGDSSRESELIDRYNLYPPYIAAVPTPGCVYPGARLILPNDLDSASEAEAYGITWSIEITSGDQYDIAADDGSGILEVAGMGALEIDLFMRASQVLGDWQDEEVANYGVPEYAIGQNASRTIGAFAVAQALTADDRVATATPLDSSLPDRRGLFISNVLVVPKPLSRNAV